MAINNPMFITYASKVVTKLHICRNFVKDKQYGKSRTFIKQVFC